MTSAVMAKVTEIRRVETPRPTLMPMTSNDGRSPDLRVVAASAFPVPMRTSGILNEARRSQLRGQSRFWLLMGNPHRVPF